MKPVSKEDAGLLLISLLIAIALWFNVGMGRQETIAEKEFPNTKLRIVGLSNKFQSEIRPEKVDILLRGLPRDLAKITPEDIDVTINLTTLLTEGRWFVTPQGSVTERRTYIVKIIPERIEVVLKTRLPQIQSDTKKSDEIQNKN